MRASDDSSQKKTLAFFSDSDKTNKQTRDSLAAGKTPSGSTTRSAAMTKSRCGLVVSRREQCGMLRCMNFDDDAINRVSTPSLLLPAPPPIHAASAAARNAIRTARTREPRIFVLVVSFYPSDSGKRSDGLEERERERKNSVRFSLTLLFHRAKESTL